MWLSRDNVQLLMATFLLLSWRVAVEQWRRRLIALRDGESTRVCDEQVFVSCWLSSLALSLSPPPPFAHLTRQSAWSRMLKLRRRATAVVVEWMNEMFVERRPLAE